MDDGLTVQIGKLAHEIEEIRVRALTSIISKLELDVINEHELFDKADLFPNLVNWFKMPNAPCKKDVLKLISRLIKNCDGVNCLLAADPGLTTLRQFVGLEFKNELDAIIHLTTDNRQSLISLIRDAVPRTSVGADSQTTERDAASISNDTSYNRGWSYREIYWPVPRLDESDTRVLSTVGTLLRDPSQSTQVANFFSTVILHDFPPQVFLHDTTILSALFDLHSRDENCEFVIRCFKVFTVSLHQHFKYYQDPASIRKIKCFGLDGDETALCEWTDPSLVDTISLRHNLGVAEFCGLCLERLGEKVPGALHLLSACLPSDKTLFWGSVGPSNQLKAAIISHLSQLVSRLRFARARDPLERVEAQVWTCRVLSSLIPCAPAASSLVPKELQQEIAQDLFDPALYLFFPKVHNVFRNYVHSFMYQEDNGFETFRELGESLKFAAKFLTKLEEITVSDALVTFKASLDSLDIHQEYGAVPRFFHIATSMELSAPDVELSEEICLRLLSYPEDEVVALTYSQISSLVAGSLGPGASASRAGDPTATLGFIVTPRVLEEILQFGLTSKIVQVAENSETVLTLLLKSRMLLAPEPWSRVLSRLLPCFPLLHSLAGRMGPLSRSLLDMLDPDIASDISLTRLQILIGNARLLFSADTSVVAEAQARLFYLLDIQPISSVFSMPEPPPTHGPSAPVAVFDEESVVRVMEVLRELDGRMLRSALTQVSLMSDDPSLHVAILETQSIPLLSTLLSNSLDERTEDAKDIFTSIVHVFKNLGRYSQQIRFDFSVDYTLYVNIIKGVFTLPAERRCLREATQLLTLMCFADHVISRSDGLVSLPKLLIDRLKLPLSVEVHSAVSIHAAPSKKLELFEKTEGWRFLSAVWCAELDKLAGAGGASLSSPQPPLIMLPPSALSSASPLHSLDLCLTDLSAAASHSSAYKALGLISRYVRLVPWCSGDLKDLLWESSFRRYLTTQPASPADQNLLVSIVRLLADLVVLLPDETGWVSRLLKDPSLMLCSLLAQTTVEDSTSLRKELSLELLALVEKCLKGGDMDGWASLANVLLQCLTHSHTQKFYSLALVDRLLGCLLRLAESGTLNRTSRAPLWTLLVAFHCPSRTSFMGLTITKQAIFALNSLLSTTKETKAPEEVSRLPNLLNARDLLVRAAALELATHLSRQNLCLSSLLHLVPDLWTLSLKILMDLGESSLVREEAAILCSNIVANSFNKTYVADSIDSSLFPCLTVTFARFRVPQDTLDITVYRPEETSFADSGGLVSDGVGGGTTARLVMAVCVLTTNLMSRDSAKLIQAATSSGFIPALVRDVSVWRCSETLSDQLLVDMYTAVVCLLVHSLTPQSTPPLLEALPVLLWLLDQTNFEENLKLVPLTKEVLKLIGMVLSSGPPPRTAPVISRQVMNTLCFAVGEPVLASALAAALPLLAPYLSSEASVELVAAIGDMEGLRAALAAIVGNSHSSTSMALELGLLDSALQRLTALQLKLSLAPHNTKKATAALEELCLELGLVTNFLAGSLVAKDKSAALGLADNLHKLLVWTLTDFSLLSTILRTLITFTAGSSLAAGSLVLTSTLAGVGQRKTPTSSSLLHAVVGLLSKEVYSPPIKVLLLQLLSHACQASECRTILGKSAALQEFVKVASMKKSSFHEEIELSWLQFLIVFSSFNEGQTALIKLEESVDRLLVYMSGSRGPKHRAPALVVVRNLLFNQASRQRFILSDKLLTSVSDYLTDPDLSDEELKNVFLMAWVLSANSQRGKMAVRSTGLCGRLESVMSLRGKARPESAVSQLADLVLSIVKG